MLSSFPNSIVYYLTTELDVIMLHLAFIHVTFSIYTKITRTAGNHACLMDSLVFKINCNFTSSYSA